MAMIGMRPHVRVRPRTLLPIACVAKRHLENPSNFPLIGKRSSTQPNAGTPEPPDAVRTLADTSTVLTRACSVMTSCLDAEDL